MNGHQNGAFSCLIGALNRPRKVNGYGADYAVIQFYNQRGAKEKVFDQMDNDFGWHYLPKSLLKENTVFLLLTAMLRNFFRLLLRNEALHAFGIWCTTRMKAFTAKVITVVARWTKGGRRDILTLYTSNKAYAALYADYG